MVSHGLYPHMNFQPSRLREILFQIQAVRQSLREGGV